MPVDAFLRALMRDVAWGFFYGTVNFDAGLRHQPIITAPSTCSPGSTTAGYREAEPSITSRTSMSDDVRAMFEAMLDDWTNEGFDPFAAPHRDRQRHSAPSTAAIARRSAASA